MRRFNALILIFTSLITAALPVPSIRAQDAATLVGYAAVPAGTVTDGEAAGAAFQGRGQINGIRVPFASQPFGSIVGVLPGSYPGTWLTLCSGQFDAPANSRDFALRIYTIQVDLLGAGGGTGEANPVDWITLTDPKQVLGGDIVNAGSSQRILTGADVTAVGFAQIGSSFVVADAKANRLLVFDSRGRLSRQPAALQRGTVQAIASVGNRLVVAIQSGQLLLEVVDASGSLAGAQVAYSPDSAGSIIGGITMINDDQAIVIEHDRQPGGGTKRLYLVTLSSGSKQLLADLTAISDPANLAGRNGQFSLPYAEISGVLATDAQTVVVVNNNRVPFSSARRRNQADPTEYAAIQVAQPFALNR
jgi:hypothetical protein